MGLGERMPTKIMLFARIILGLIFLIFGFNGFFQFISFEMTPAASQFMSAFVDSPYFHFLKVIEIIIGFLLLINFYVPLSLIILAPVTINIFIFHLFLDRSGMPIALAILILHFLVAYGRREAFKPLLRR